MNLCYPLLVTFSLLFVQLTTGFSISGESETGLGMRVCWTCLPQTNSVVFSGLTAPLSEFAQITVHAQTPHGYPSDSHLQLISPKGTMIFLQRQRGRDCTNAFADMTWDDNAEYSSRDFICNGGETALRPDTPLSTFRGEDPNGKWTISYDDTFVLVDGALEYWKITIEGYFLLPFFFFFFFFFFLFVSNIPFF